MRFLLGRLLVVAGLAWSQVENVSVDFLVLAGDGTQLAVEEDIRVALGKIGIDVKARILPKEELNAAVVDGDFHMVFADTYGAPYDPHGYLSGWSASTEFHYQSLTAMEAPLDLLTFPKLVANVSEEVDGRKRQEKWTTILRSIHDKVLHVPLWGKRIPSVVNKARIQNYEPGFQNFDYPLHGIRVAGIKNVTVAPGAQGGLFESVGQLDPHTYRPNEFFANNWVYEGLLSYGPEGAIEPALATSWTIEKKSTEGEVVRFALREGVTFHDGSAFNCSVVDLNFDHVFALPLREQVHNWYNLPKYLSDWYCEDDFTFVLETSRPYYPLLQELTYIRPLRMLSPLGFQEGLKTSPITQNSCKPSWGTFASTADPNVTATCAGIAAISGTGPFKFLSRDTDDLTGRDDSVLFARHDDYWAGPVDVEYLTVARYDDSSAVKADLLKGHLDMVLGAGVLSPKDLEDIRLNYAESFQVSHTEPVQNTLAIFNAAKAPTDDIDIRKLIVHALDKGPIIDKHFDSNAEEPAAELFPKTAPYCDVNLVPRFDYDFEKAVLLKTIMTYKQYEAKKE